MRYIKTLYFILIYATLNIFISSKLSSNSKNGDGLEITITGIKYESTCSNFKPKTSFALEFTTKGTPEKNEYRFMYALDFINKEDPNIVVNTECILTLNENPTFICSSLDQAKVEGFYYIKLKNQLIVFDLLINPFNFEDQLIEYTKKKYVFPYQTYVERSYDYKEASENIFTLRFYDNLDDYEYKMIINNKEIKCTYIFSVMTCTFKEEDFPADKNEVIYQGGLINCCGRQDIEVILKVKRSE